MHPSTIAAILAFTAGMTVNAVPVIRPEGTPEPPADRPRTTLENSQAQPQLRCTNSIRSEPAEDEFNIHSVGKRDHPPRPMPYCPGIGEVSAAIPCISRPLTARATKGDSQRLVGDDVNNDHLGNSIPQTLEESLETEKQAGFSKEKRQYRRPFPISSPLNIPPSADLPSLTLSEELRETKKQAGLGKEKRQLQDSRYRIGIPEENQLTPEELEELLNNYKEPRKDFSNTGAMKRDSRTAIDKEPLGHFGWRPLAEVLPPIGAQKRDPQVIDAGATFDPTILPEHLVKLPPSYKAKQFGPGHTEKRDPQRTRPGDSRARIPLPSQDESKFPHISIGKRDPQIDAGFGFDAGITIDPVALPGHLKKLLPGQKSKRDPQRNSLFGDVVRHNGFSGHESDNLPVKKRDAQRDQQVSDLIRLPGRVPTPAEMDFLNSLGKGDARRDRINLPSFGGNTLESQLIKPVGKRDAQRDRIDLPAFGGNMPIPELPEPVGKGDAQRDRLDLPAFGGNMPISELLKPVGKRDAQRNRHLSDVGRHNRFDANTAQLHHFDSLGKRDPQIDADFGFDAGITIDPTTLPGHLTKLIPGRPAKREAQRNRHLSDVVGIPEYDFHTPESELIKPFGKRDPQIDADFGFDTSITIDPTTVPGYLSKLTPGRPTKRDTQRNRNNQGNRHLLEVVGIPEYSPHIAGVNLKPLGKRDPQIDADFGFDAGITIDPIALPGHLIKLLPGQKNKRDPQNRGKGHVFGKIAEGVVGGIGAIADGLTIHQALQGKQA
ncbi:hypothetical protein COCMIDRAFT_30786 [Bipolaris oryzae ATCC 44560]|uniref:Uncharacterized protein n=1 Tax=Bipolaris oryzae ATCC 44560 TaxID=930090 RepID=W6YRK4_COCMI|nr:uncharacterized protein COCMIDRAFT_30786 [Bipolaris oryzae ATCC 44560]EUC40250.1 hypothetical protein COCMIDRAFT_30786 [Bipolaris oryzae ATCC 44560]